MLENGLGEGLALDCRNLELLGGGLTRTITAGKGASTPRATTVDLSQVCQLSKGLGVTERHIDDAVVSEGRHGGNGGRLLSTTRRASGNEEATELAVIATSSPLPASLVPESLVCNR